MLCRPLWSPHRMRSSGPSTWCCSSRFGWATCPRCSRVSANRWHVPVSHFREGANPLAAKGLTGRSARVVVTMGMPATIYRWYFRAHSIKSLERNILGFVGIAPVHETLVGMVGNMEPALAKKWLSRLEKLGERGD